MADLLEHLGICDEALASGERLFQQAPRIELVRMGRTHQISGYWNQPGSLLSSRKHLASTLHFHKHLLDVSGREIMTCRGANGAQLGPQNSARLTLMRLTQRATNPLRDGRAMATRDRLELVPLVCIQQPAAAYSGDAYKCRIKHSNSAVKPAFPHSPARSTGRSDAHRYQPPQTHRKPRVTAPIRRGDGGGQDQRCIRV
jgi:hypothetical protein